MSETVTSTTTTPSTEVRPGPVTFVGVVLCVKAVIAIVVGLAILVEKNDLVLLSSRSDDYLTTTAITEFIVAALLVVGAWAIFSGQKWARLIVAVIVGFRMAVVSYWMIGHVGGGMQWNAIIAVGFGALVLWSLYGNQESNDFFAGTP
jgi:hypothetical protein